MFDGLHGRALPVVLGIKMANPAVKVIATSGDGCFYAEGGNHFIHNLRRNLDVAILASDNRVYGLTKGQASPTSASDFKTKVHIEGVGALPLNPAALALVSGATFVARTFTGAKAEATELIKKALLHRGAAVIDIMSPCVSFNKVNTFAWFRQRAKPIGPDHDVTDLHAALKLAFHDDEHIPTGVLYQTRRPVFGDHLTVMQGESIVQRTLRFTPDRVRPLFKDFY
jgi:2-oxoglutarate ferredoxin oxidoreductase subunit beta